MKKSEALKLVDPRLYDRVKDLKRKGLYYLSSSNDAFDRTPVMITHFYKFGIRLKVLVNTPISNDTFYQLNYRKMNRYTLDPMPIEDLPLYVDKANTNMSDAFKRGIDVKA